MNKDFEKWAALIEQDGLIVSEDGSVRFTGKHKADLTGLFGLAGIDIRSIRTQRQYLNARMAAEPFFMQWLTMKAGQGELTLERQLLIAIASGDQERKEKLTSMIESERMKTPE